MTTRDGKAKATHQSMAASSSSHGGEVSSGSAHIGNANATPSVLFNGSQCELYCEACREPVCAAFANVHAEHKASIVTLSKAMETIRGEYDAIAKNARETIAKLERREKECANEDTQQMRVDPRNEIDTMMTDLALLRGYAAVGVESGDAKRQKMQPDLLEALRNVRERIAKLVANTSDTKARCCAPVFTHIPNDSISVCTTMHVTAILATHTRLYVADFGQSATVKCITDANDARNPPNDISKVRWSDVYVRKDAKRIGGLCFLRNDSLLVLAIGSNTLISLKHDPTKSDKTMTEHDTIALPQWQSHEDNEAVADIMETGDGEFVVAF